MSSYLLSIDQGTTGTTVLVVDADGKPVGSAYQEFAQHFPQDGWVEHDAEELWQSVATTIPEALRAAGVRGHDCRGIGITNQRETTLLWSRQDGKAVHPALVWQDRRTAPLCAELRAQGHAPRFRKRTGLVLDPYFSGTKLRWLLDEVPGAGPRAAAGELAFGTVDTFLIWRLTGGTAHCTDVTNAARTLLFDPQTEAWDAGLADILQVPMALLPEVHACTAHFGLTAGAPGLPDGIPICGVAGDQNAAMVGQACFAPGDGKCTYGTGAFLLLNTGPSFVSSEHGLLTTIAWKIGAHKAYALEGSAFIAGAAVQWLRDGLGLIQESAEIEALAGEVSDAGGVTFVPALAGLGAPHWDPEARGLLCGLTRDTRRAHVARAVLEGVALQIADLSEAIARDADSPLRVLKVDGGAAKNDLLMQYQADVLDVVVERPEHIESTALGAAYLAAIGAGVLPDQHAIASKRRVERLFRPEMSAERRDAAGQNWWLAEH
ncbi:MAG: glycerol kinase GlpK, partial [Polyangiales bacterium]